LEDLPLKTTPAIPPEAKRPLPSTIETEEARIKEANKRPPPKKPKERK
jgi:hypothetical protein